MEGWEDGGMGGWEDGGLGGLDCREGNIVAAENLKLKTSKLKHGPEINPFILASKSIGSQASQCKQAPPSCASSLLPLLVSFYLFKHSETARFDSLSES